MHIRGIWGNTLYYCIHSKVENMKHFKRHLNYFSSHVISDFKKVNAQNTVNFALSCTTLLVRPTSAFIYVIICVSLTNLIKKIRNDLILSDLFKSK